MCHHTHHRSERRRVHPDAARPRAAERSPTLRVSDAEREQTLEALRAHAAAGRLGAEELDARLERTFAAVTRGDLAAVQHDLPPHGPPRSGRAEERSPEWLVYGLVAVVLLSIWALSGAGTFWPAWPLGFWGLALVTKGGIRGRAGPGRGAGAA
jgi:hypothetical protein